MKFTGYDQLQCQDKGMKNIPRLFLQAGFTHADFVSRHKILEFPSKIQARIGPKSVNCSEMIQNPRSHCIDAKICLSLLGEYQKSADKLSFVREDGIFFLKHTTALVTTLICLLPDENMRKNVKRLKLDMAMINYRWSPENMLKSVKLAV